MSQDHEQNNPVVKPNLEALGGFAYEAAESQAVPSESDELKSMLISSEIIGEGFEVTPVSDVGYVIRLPEQEAIPGNDWVLFDQDDTLIAYSDAKSVRQKNFEDYAKTTGLALDKDQCKTLLSVTDKFSRWQDGDAVMYHLDAHKMALGWATSVLRATPDDQVEATLEAIKLQLQTEDHSIPSTETSNEDLEDVFSAMVEPPSYDDVLEAVTTLANSGTPETDVNIGIYTYGEPKFQLTKVIKLMEAQARKGKPLPVSQIWLTKASKGIFIDQLVEQLEAEPADNTLKTELFDEAPHVIMLVDDSDKQLDGFSNSNRTIFPKTGTRLARMRLVKSGTKAESSDWGLAGHPLFMNAAVGAHDSRSKDSGLLSANIYKFLTGTLSIAINKRLEAEGQRTAEPALAKRLNARIQTYAEKARAGADFSGGMYLVKLAEESEEDIHSLTISA
jgi:hypothetical protein